MWGKGGNVQSVPAYQPSAEARATQTVPAYQPDVDGSATSLYSEAEPTHSANIAIMVPADAALFFNGQKTKQTSGLRVFTTPPLRPGGYTYEVKASWRTSDRLMTQVRQIAVRPGDNVIVDFTKALPAVVVLPKN
jgi:uncharacterized protein (TIGR03000 family)